MNSAFALADDGTPEVVRPPHIGLGIAVVTLIGFVYFSKKVEVLSVEMESLVTFTSMSSGRTPAIADSTTMSLGVWYTSTVSWALRSRPSSLAPATSLILSIVSDSANFARKPNAGLAAIMLGDQATAAGVRRINVSLDTLDPDKFRAITRWGDLDKVLAGIEAARDAGADLIVAINTDKNAPIFDFAHVGIITDAIRLLPALTEAFRARLSPHARDRIAS